MSNRKRLFAAPNAPSMRIAFACNDPDNGLFAYEASGLIIQDRLQSVDLEPSLCNPPRMTVMDDHIRIFRRPFPFSASIGWVGNWCWNEYRMRVDDVARLLWCALKSGFTTTGAAGDEACELCDLCDEYPECDEHALRDQLVKMVIVETYSRKAS